MFIDSSRAITRQIPNLNSRGNSPNEKSSLNKNIRKKELVRVTLENYVIS